MTGIILAGGKNSRMGTNKAFLKIGNKRIIDNILFIYKRIFNDIIIVTNTPEEYNYLGVKLIKDIIPGCGPIGGIYSGLLASKEEHCFVAACDMPFIKEKFIKYIISFKNSDFDVVVPVISARYNPLFALYSKKCLSIIKDNIAKGDYKIINIFSKVRLKEIGEDEIKKIDPEFNSLININTPEEYKKVLKNL